MSKYCLICMGYFECTLWFVSVGVWSSAISKDDLHFSGVSLVIPHLYRSTVGSSKIFYLSSVLLFYQLTANSYCIHSKKILPRSISLDRILLDFIGFSRNPLVRIVWCGWAFLSSENMYRIGKVHSHRYR